VVLFNLVLSSGAQFWAEPSLSGIASENYLWWADTGVGLGFFRILELKELGVLELDSRETAVPLWGSFPQSHTSALQNCEAILLREVHKLQTPI